MCVWISDFAAVSPRTRSFFPCAHNKNYFTPCCSSDAAFLPRASSLPLGAPGGDWIHFPSFFLSLSLLSAVGERGGGEKERLASLSGGKKTWGRRSETVWSSENRGECSSSRRRCSYTLRYYAFSAVFKRADPGSYITISEPQSRKMWHDMCLFCTISGIGGRNNTYG